MSAIWKPSWLGKLCTRSPDWSIELDHETFELTVSGSVVRGSVGQLNGIAITPGALWADVQVPFMHGELLTLSGLANARAQQLEHALANAVEVKQKRLQLERMLGEFDQQARQVVSWVGEVGAASERQLARRGWLSRDFIEQVERSKPPLTPAFLDSPLVQKHLLKQSQAIQLAIQAWREPFKARALELNTRHAAQVIRDDKAFFDQVEKSPLTAEQRDAVICFDSRLLLVAAAGSGKTSVMVAKAGYALARKYFAPERILLLAFNSDAAAELRERIQARLAPLGLAAEGITAKTFHAFGLDVIGAATGKKPSLAPWLDGGQDLDTLVELVDELKDRDARFRTQWDMFRIVLGQDLPRFGKEQDEPNAWDRERGRLGFWTLQGEVVKSQGEVVLANWLFYNGVRYVYEGEYEHDVADAKHRQYRPDFYLPDANAYLEHWGLDERGEPPKEFTGYKVSMAWKRDLHRAMGTTLLETTMAQLWSGEAFEYLARELQNLGVVLDPNPDRPVTGRQPIENPRLARTFRTFLTHVKSNRLTMQNLLERLRQGRSDGFRFRHEMFLHLFEKLWQAWEAKLHAANCIDFEDMLILATDCLESGRWQSPYELVMVDEFQDASQARARMAAALTQGEDRYLFAVGDDWQSINRFAGADLTVMTGFEDLFGQATTMKLETTFRCPPSLCKISSEFVQQNPQQIAKQVKSPKADVEDAVRIVQVEHVRHVRDAVEARLREIASEAAAANKQASVYVLGRYKRDRESMPNRYDKRWIQLSFLTVHRSKGLEADHIIVPRVTSEVLGIPSKIADDPVLQLAMPSLEGFVHAEERRLFYVALTRAKATTTLITVQHQESSFITELIKEQGLKLTNRDGTEGGDELCPKCGKGFVKQRTSKYGQFWSCSTFPRCDFKRSGKRGSGI